MSRIGIVANTSWNIVNFRLGLLKALREAGHEIIVFSPLDEHTSKITENEFKFVEIKGLARKGTNPLSDLKLIAEFYTLYKKNQLDIVLQYTIKPNIYGNLAAKLAGIKSVCTVTGLGYVFLNKGISSTAARFLYKFSFLFANKVFFQNQDDNELFITKGLVSKNKSEVVPGSGIDTTFYEPGYCNAITPQPMTFIMIARLLKDKGIYEYIQAAEKIRKKYPQTIFLLAGNIDHDNPASITQQELDRWISDKSVEYLGFINDPRPHICRSNAVVLPSYREGIPRVILEGLSMGRPCITTDAPGCRHTVEDGIDGYLCKTADADSLTLTIEKFILLPDEKKNTMAQNARKNAISKFDLDIITKKYLFTVKEL